MDNNILVQNLCRQFEDFSLDNVSFKVPKGRIVGFIGENGAGKSTTINLILNEINKDSGQVQVFGSDHTIPTVKENIGVVFDECNFHDVFTTADIEKILKGVYRTWDSDLFSQYLKKFKIPTTKTIGTFSKGMKMKLSIICAMAHRPKLLILDEATTGLDPVVRDEILDLFLEFIQDEDRSIFFSSMIFQNFDMLIWVFSIAAAIIIPLIWTGVCLPLTYWFGFRSAQTMGLIIVIPMFYFVKYFEDGPGIAAMVNSVYSYILIAGIAAILIFGISLVISTIGYNKKN